MNYFEKLGFTQGDGFGWRKLNGKDQYHRGTDIRKLDKSRIDAFVPGTVRHAKFGAKGSGLGGYGNCVAIEDKYGKLHIYGHLNSICVHVEQSITKGQQLGTQGNTGDSYGSHLHYEVRRKASPSFGYTEAIDNVIEPTKYVVDYYVKEQPKATINYYPATPYRGDSIAAGLNQIKVDSSFTNRAKIAAKNGIARYQGSGPQNLAMLKLLIDGKLIK